MLERQQALLSQFVWWYPCSWVDVNNALGLSHDKASPCDGAWRL